MTEGQRRDAARRRQARYRERLKARAQAHDAGDHSTCRPVQCGDAQPARSAEEEPGGVTGVNNPPGDPLSDADRGVTRDVTAPPENSVSHRPRPADLGPRGGRLWDEMDGLMLSPHHVLQLERTCRMADRLDVLDEMAKGRAWVEVVPVPNTDGAVLQLVVDKVLSEIRQIETVLTRSVAELRYAGRPASGTAGTPPSGTAPTPPQQRGADDDDEPQAGWTGNVTSIAGILGQSAVQG